MGAPDERDPSHPTRLSSRLPDARPHPTPTLSTGAAARPPSRPSSTTPRAHHTHTTHGAHHTTHHTRRTSPTGCDAVEGGGGVPPALGEDVPFVVSLDELPPEPTEEVVEPPGVADTHSSPERREP